MANWNHIFTKLLRQSQRAFWGNWALDVNIQPGAAGVLSSDGTFGFAGQLPAGPGDVLTTPAPFAWKFASSNVVQTAATFDLSGGVTPPAGGTSGSLGLTLTWEFSKAESLVSQFAQIEEASLASPVAFLQAQRAPLLELATPLGAATSTGKIVQGFGVVTGVYLAQSGVNVGSVSDKSSFSLSGELNAVQAMIGAGGAAHAGYTKTSQSQIVDEHLWPSAPSPTPAPPPAAAVPVAYTFASFEGDDIILNWVGPFQALELLIDNHGSYILHAKVTYNAASRGGHQTQTLTATGGLSRGMSLPLDARDVVVSMNFSASSQTHQFSFPEPLNQWLPSRKCLIDVRGFAPGGIAYQVTFPGATDGP